MDPTGDATASQQDLYSLQDLGITSINLNPQSKATASNGNIILDDSTFTWQGGATGDIAGVELIYNPTSFASTINTPSPTSAPDALTTAVNSLASDAAGVSLTTTDQNADPTTTLFGVDAQSATLDAVPASAALTQHPA